jgi:hypothetical protein
VNVSRPGTLLPMVLMALAFASALAVGGTFVARQLARSVRMEMSAEQLQPAAERALVESIAAWDSVSRGAQPLGSTLALPFVASSSPSVVVWVTRLDAASFWLVAESSAGTRPLLRRRIGLVVRSAGGVPTLVPGRAWGDLP